MDNKPWRWKPIVRAVGVMAVAGVAGAVLAHASSAGTISDRDLDSFTVIAGGWQLERRCEHLNEPSHSELGDIAAQAELEIASEIGTERVREIMTAAREFGEEQASDCNEHTADAVRLSLDVAHEYAQARTEANTPAVEPHEQSQQSEQRDATVEWEAEGGRTDVLERFGEQTRAYHLQLRCDYLRYRDAHYFWELIVYRHDALIRQYGAGAVGRVERQAESRANSSQTSCGSQSHQAIRSGYDAIRQDVSVN
jgi:hypothetical protein